MPHALAFLLLLQGPSTAPVVINEFSYDDSGTDTHEFIELYNRSGAPVDISGWVVDCGDSPTTCQTTCTPGCSETTNNNGDFTIPGAPLSGTTILAAGDYYVIGMVAVPNVDQPAGVVTIENDEEWIVLKDGAAAIVDAVSFEVNLQNACFPAAHLEGPGIYGNNVMTDTGQLLSVSRVPDGYDSNNNGTDFGLLPWTPGATNDSLANALPISETFDAGIVGSSTTLLRGSFVTPRVIDPTLADANNPNAIAASPQGANALICWDPTGGGNAGVLLSQPTDRIDLECYVYLDAAPHAVAAIAQFETWTLGVQGTTDSFGNHPDPAAFLAANGVTGLAHPNTGIGWTYLHHTTIPGVSTSILYLVDYNDGGTDNVVLGSIPITAGGNDGWQRLRLRVNGSKVDGWLGGPLGTTEGVHLGGTAAQPRAGTAYFQYRELVSVNAGARPLTIDGLTVRAAEAGVDPAVPPVPCAGSGACAPTITWSGGDASLSAPGPFAVGLSRALAPASAILLISTSTAGPVDLATILPPASAPCYLLQSFFFVKYPVTTAGPGPCGGTASVGFPNLVGAFPGGTVYLQYVVFDPAGPLAIPAVMSDGLVVTVLP
ncbi:MAG: lamin tail domain-containing protein [Planctomycetes bacterium]|nr:lamin tail domain-containing protein [Planctomycetota bacterium]